VRARSRVRVSACVGCCVCVLRVVCCVLRVVCWGLGFGGWVVGEEVEVSVGLRLPERGAWD